MSILGVVAKNVSAVTKRFFSNERVFERWVGTEFDISLNAVENFINLYDERVVVRSRGIYLRDGDYDTSTIGKNWVP